METDYWDEVTASEIERRKRMEKQKVYVSALSFCDNLGKQTPKIIQWIDGTEYPIDEIISVDFTGAVLFGGRAKKYKVKIGKNITYLYYDNKHWYVYKKN